MKINDTFIDSACKELFYDINLSEILIKIKYGNIYVHISMTLLNGLCVYQHFMSLYLNSVYSAQHLQCFRLSVNSIFLSLRRFIYAYLVTRRYSLLRVTK